MANTVTVRLIRHEKTKANVERRYVGQTDASILPVLARSMTHSPEKVYGSALKRCLQTSQLYFPHATYVQHERLNEIHFGEFEMKTYADLQHNALYRAWIDDPFSITPPNGESFESFRQRVLQAFFDIVQEAGEYTFVVHGGVIRVLLQAFYFKEKSFQHITADHHTEYKLEWLSFEAMKEGHRCISYSADYLTEKPTM